jgi:exosortase K
MILKNVKAEIIDLVYIAMVFIFSGIIIWAYHMADDNVTAVLLTPHAKITEVFYNIDLRYVSHVGYTGLNTAFVIAKDCLGVYFIAMLFCMFICGFIKQFTGVKKLCWFWISLIMAVVVGVLVSCIRIIGSIPFVGYDKFATLHTGIGATLYLLTLIACYAILKKSLRRKVS